MQRLRRGAITAVGSAVAVVALTSCGKEVRENRQNTLHPDGPAAHTAPEMDELLLVMSCGRKK